VENGNLTLEVILLVGLPASGKSTLFRQRWSETHVHVSKDNFRNHSQPAKRQARELRRALESGQSVVVDNTNASPEERAAVITIAKEYGAWVICYVFPFDVAGCRQRNDLREGVAKVPLVGIYATAKRYRPPLWEESFDALYQVRLVEGGFEVEPMPTEEASEAT